MEFKGRKERAECYDARDAYFACTDKQPKDADAKAACKEFFDKFEKSCGCKWTEHFIRKRDYTRFKEKLETEGIQSIDEKKFK